MAVVTTFRPATTLRPSNPQLFNRIGRDIVITKEMLERFNAFKGDMDKWVRSQKDGRDDVLTGTDWTTIEKLIQRLKLEKNGFATMEYRGETERLLNKTLENSEAKLFALTMV
jgi:hypothetical protein